MSKRVHTDLMSGTYNHTRINFEPREEQSRRTFTKVVLPLYVDQEMIESALTESAMTFYAGYARLCLIYANAIHKEPLPLHGDWRLLSVNKHRMAMITLSIRFKMFRIDYDYIVYLSSMRSQLACRVWTAHPDERLCCKFTAQGT